MRLYDPLPLGPILICRPSPKDFFGGFASDHRLIRGRVDLDDAGAELSGESKCLHRQGEIPRRSLARKQAQKCITPGFPEGSFRSPSPVSREAIVARVLCQNSDGANPLGSRGVDRTSTRVPRTDSGTQ